jgi:pimeloyl-ACP methyl ester carboxylesterase
MSQQRRNNERHAMSGPAQDSPSLLLVHGAWHGSWCWGKLTPLLTGAGWAVHTVNLPSVAEKGKPRHGLHDDACAVREQLNAIDGPVVVVAHSYGGAPATEAAAGIASVQHIIYLAAFVLDAGESLFGLVGGQAPPWWNIDGDTVTPDTPREIFYNDVNGADASAAIARLLPHSMSAVEEQVTAAAWKTTLTSYILCERDNAVPVFAQEQMASRTSQVYRLPSSHSPFLSRPAELAALITDIANPLRGRS